MATNKQIKTIKRLQRCIKGYPSDLWFNPKYLSRYKAKVHIEDLIRLKRMQGDRYANY
ncbi:hypothetical protein QTA71_07865 [Staphylococcus haemolyticus]|uniref:hypothetical protein n=1 Tax=Staphylococcus haemolyticus TaxID=1283 RepID=UPI001F0B6D00|nr:hypothetical protein [Staphylococcus haemolyticus]MCH4520145.1 hypothetical protein [Staphylococcus haemolyticus]MDR5621873.1 hypothetical protein [Staphylococcus haemolyticus]